MKPFVKAVSGKNHTVIYTDTDGRHFRFSGGTWAWRNHNPVNLYPDGISAKHNQIGRAKIGTSHFAIFSDYENGHLALIDCLQTTYGEKSIDQLVQKFSPKEAGNNVKVYKKFLHDKTGVHDDKKVKNFTPDEFDKLWRAIEQMESYKEGAIIEVFPVIQVHKNKNGINELNIQQKGWTPKSECIQLAKQGVLDLAICTSHEGHEYLRARKESLVNNNLEKLVVKNHSKAKNPALV